MRFVLLALVGLTSAFIEMREELHAPGPEVNKKAKPTPSPIDPDEACFEVGKWRPLFDIPIHKITQSAQECQRACQGIVDCTWFQWTSNDKSIRQKAQRGLCQLKTCMPPPAHVGYSTMRIKKCDKTFCKDSHEAGGYQPRGGEEVYFDNRPVNRRVKQNDPRSWANLIYNGPKHCDEKPSNCTDMYCSEYNTNYIGDKIMNGGLTFTWNELDPMGQCRDACSGNEFCNSWTLVYAPEWQQKDGPYYCDLHGSLRGDRKLNNSYSAPQKCERCQHSDIINMTATGEIEEVAASTEEMYQNIIDNCHASTDLQGEYKASVTNSLTKTEEISMSRTLKQTFKHTLANHFGMSMSIGFSYYVDFSFSLSYDLTDTREIDREEAQTTTRVKTETVTKVVSVESGFSYTVPGRKKIKVQSTAKRLDGVLPWTANARCLDAHGNMLEQKNIFGNYKSYGLSTSQVSVYELPCDAGGGGEDPGRMGACDFVFSPQGACTACGMKPMPEEPNQPSKLKWVCDKGCVGVQCLCRPPYQYAGNGECIGMAPTVAGQKTFAAGNGIVVTPNHEFTHVNYVDLTDVPHAEGVYYPDPDHADVADNEKESSSSSSSSDD